ncbi:hypothetical protein V8G54_005228 [Vigna mungo]|uniref:HMA domain-containing protein n=1 Tax=Vigna mungo TaxID=3915 RepID=A0AAQ3PIB6_VIGMU
MECVVSKRVDTVSFFINENSSRKLIRERGGLVLGSEMMTMTGENEKGERWSGAMTNLTEMSSNLESLQKLLLTKAVFVDDDTFSKASLTADQARSIKLLQQRVETLEREVDAAITAAARARSEKRQAEAAQKAAESRAQQLTAELENTTRFWSPIEANRFLFPLTEVFELHMEELRAKQEEIQKRDEDIKLLEAIIRTLGGKESLSTDSSAPNEDKEWRKCKVDCNFKEIAIIVDKKRMLEWTFEAVQIPMKFVGPGTFGVVELKVEMVCIHEKRLRKCLSKLKGIEKVEVDTNCQKVVVTGYTHKNKILKAIRRGGLKADFWSAQNELLNAYVSANYTNLRFNPFNFF